MKFKDDNDLLDQLTQLIRLKTTDSPYKLAKKLSLSRIYIYPYFGNHENNGFPIAYSKGKKSYT